VCVCVCVCTPMQAFVDHLSQLPDHPITLGANQLLDGAVAEDDIRVLANLHPAPGIDQDLEPSIPWELLGHHDTLGPAFIVHLRARRANFDRTSSHTYSLPSNNQQK